MMIGPLFIVSTGRTGTTFLAEFLALHEVNALHEPGPPWLRWASNAYVSGHLSIEGAKRLLARARADLTQPYVESSCLIYGLVEPLLTHFPKSQVVHIVRDPRTYVRSGMNWGAYRFAGRVKNLLPFRRLAPPQFEPLSISQRVSWMKQGQFERLCWAWSSMNKGMREQGAGNERFRTVRFEDMVDAESGYPGLQEIARLAGLDLGADRLSEFGSKQVNAPRRTSFPRWLDWTDEQLLHLRDQCAREARRYGYELEDDIRKVLADRRQT